MLRTVEAIRYVLPFREGGSVPALVEGDDLGMYVVKLRGAGQGAKALVAELISGELARAVGLRVPEIVFVDVPRELAASEPDPEICEPLEASAGLNLGLDYLPGSITFDPAAGPPPDEAFASLTVLFDAFVLNVDRTARNPNLLSWHGRVWLIDHGASLYFHYGWTPRTALEGADDPFSEIAKHVLLPWAGALDAAATRLRAAVTDDVIERIVDSVPTTWADRDSAFPDVASLRRAYVEWLRARVAALPLIEKEAARAHAIRV